MNDVGLEDFVEIAEPRLRRALLGAVGTDRVEDAVAEVLDVSPSTVATHVSRGLARLRDEMGVVVV